MAKHISSFKRKRILCKMSYSANLMFTIEGRKNIYKQKIKTIHHYQTHFSETIKMTHWINKNFPKS